MLIEKKSLADNSFDSLEDNRGIHSPVTESSPGVSVSHSVVEVVCRWTVRFTVCFLNQEVLVG